MKGDKFFILICDDEEDLLELYGESVEMEGFYVETASNGQEAFDIFMKGGVDVIMSDDNMPKMNGRKLLEAVNNAQLPRPLFYFSTGSPNVEKELLEKGADKVLVKPYDINDVI